MATFVSLAAASGLAAWQDVYPTVYPTAPFSVSGTPTSFTIQNEDLTLTTFRGTGFQFGADFLPLAGTVTTIERTDNTGTTIFERIDNVPNIDIGNLFFVIPIINEIIVFAPFRGALSGDDELSTTRNDAVTLDGFDGSDSLQGSPSDDLLQGGRGNDSLRGGAGDDALHGVRFVNDGNTDEDGPADVAVYAGSSGDFTIALNPDGTFTVTDQNAADGLDEGSDTLTDIEKLLFEGDGVTFDLPEVSLSITPRSPADLAIVEGTGAGNGGVATFDIVFNGDVPDVLRAFSFDVDVTIAGTGANPVLAADFPGGIFPSTTLTFAPGESSKVLQITANPEDFVEPAEAYSITLSPVGVNIAGDSLTAEILNDDTESPTANVDPVISIADVTMLEGDPVSGLSDLRDVELTITADGPVPEDVFIDFFTVNGSTTGLFDFRPLPPFGSTDPIGSATILAGATSTSFTVQFVQDFLVEGDENFFVDIIGATRATGGVTVADGRAEVTIINDDSTQLVATQLAPAVEGQPVPVTFSLTNPVDVPVTASFVPLDGSALADQDYVDVPLYRATFPSRIQTVRADIETLDDAVPGEGAETFFLQNVFLDFVTPEPDRAGQLNPPAGDALLTILDNDTGAPSTLAIAPLDAEKDDGPDGAVTPFTFTVTRAGDTSQPASVDYVVTGSTLGTGGLPASADDFDGGVFPSGMVLFAAGETSKIVSVPVVGDAPGTSEPNEDFAVTLENPVGAAISVPQAIGTILNSGDFGILNNRIVSVTESTEEITETQDVPRVVAQVLRLPDDCGEILLFLNADGSTAVELALTGETPLTAEAAALLADLDPGAFPVGGVPPAPPSDPDLSGASNGDVLATSTQTFQNGPPTEDSTSFRSISQDPNTIFIGDPQQDLANVLVVTGVLNVITTNTTSTTVPLTELTVIDSVAVDDITVADAIALLGGDPELADILAALEAKLEPENQDPVAQNDSFMVDADAALNGEDVLADNGNGEDSDPDGDPLTVTAVNGEAADIGSEIALPSGALLTLNDDGSFDYDPNGAFDDVPAGEMETDSFTYTIDDGKDGTDTATATITVKGTESDGPSIEVTKSVQWYSHGHHGGHHWGHHGGWRHKKGHGDSVKAKFIIEVRNTSEDPADAELILESIFDDNGTPDLPDDDFDVLDVWCSFKGGDSDWDGMLDVGEVWRFGYKDRVSFDGQDSVTNTALATARNASSGEIASDSDSTTLERPEGGGGKEPREPFQFSDLLEGLRELPALFGAEDPSDLSPAQAAGIGLIAFPILLAAVVVDAFSGSPDDQNETSINA